MFQQKLLSSSVVQYKAMEVEFITSRKLVWSSGVSYCFPPDMREPKQRSGRGEKRRGRKPLERLPFEWKKSVFPVGDQMEQAFPLEIFQKKGNICTFRGIPLFSLSLDLTENHCTIYFLTLVPCLQCSLVKRHDFPQDNGVLLHVSASNMRFSFWTSKTFFFDGTDERKSNLTIRPLKVAWLDFLGGIPPKFERQLCRRE